MEYNEFLKNKQKHHVRSGFDIDENQLNPMMFDFQRFIVKRALLAGKYAIFADCGLGKTLMQLEWANRVSIHTNKPVLILAPLAVSGQTIKEGAKFHIDVVKYDGSQSPIQITNYEQLGTIERLIHLYTNKGDTVLTPFMGIGSEVYQAVKMGRKGVGFELKESYYSMAKKNIQSAVMEKAQSTLF